MTISNYGPLQVVNTSTMGSQYQSSVAGLATGKILVTWYDDQQPVADRGRYYDALGNPFGAEVIATVKYGGSTWTQRPRVAADPDGGFTLTYTAADPGGVHTALLVANSTATPPFHEAIAGNNSIELVAKPMGVDSVLAFQDLGSRDIELYRRTGDLLIHPQTANTATLGQQESPDIAVLAGDTRYVVSWWDDQQKTVKFRLFDSNDQPLTSEVAAGWVGIETAPFGTPGVAALTGGNFVVVWSSSGASTVDANNSGVQASVYDPNGIPVKVDLQVNTSTFSSQFEPTVVGLLDGGFAVAWTDFSVSPGHRTVLRTFDATGTPTSPEFLVDGAGHDDGNPHLTRLADGRLAVTWDAFAPVSQDSSGFHVEMQIVDPRSAAVSLAAIDVGADLVGTAFNDTFIDGLGNDRFTGNGGADSVSFARATSGVTVDLGLEAAQAIGGGLGTDWFSGITRLIGSNFNDRLTGSAGDDTLDGAAGADVMSGGLGNDTYVVDSAQEVVSEAGGAGIDTVESTVTFGLAAGVENLTLTGLAAINGTGNTLANLIHGNAAANVLNGGAGADTMTGGAGNDTYVVDRAGDVVSEAGGAGVDTIRSSATFSLVRSAHVLGNVENLTLTGSATLKGTGNSLANTLVGNAGANLLKGGAGNDIILGGLGNDLLYGETGRDKLSGGAGNDRFYFTSALTSANIDRVSDFAHGHDKLVLENHFFKGLHTGTLAAAAFHAGTHAADADHRIIYNRSTGALYFDSDGIGGHAQVEFALLTNKPLLTAGDFAVI